jgi:uncharacterized membrane protein YdjX (TVP38/TMEM64 family)
VAREPEQRESSERSTGTPWQGIAITLAGIALIAAGILLIDPLRQAFGDAISGDTDSLRRELRDLDAGGVLILYALIAIHTFVWFPAEIVDTAAGFVYGFWPALGMVMVGWVAQAMLAYWIGRTAARPLLYRFIGAERFARGERAVESGGITLLLAARLVPIMPFSLFSYVCGAAKVPVPRFLWTTALGYFPITALFIYFGSRLDALSINDPVIWAGGLVLIGLLVLTRVLRPLVTHEKRPASEKSG